MIRHRLLASVLTASALPLLLLAAAVPAQTTGPARVAASVRPEPRPEPADEPVSRILPKRTVTLDIVGREIVVAGGAPGDSCLVLLGLELRPTPLPGGAYLLLAPLAVVTSGRLDAAGMLGGLLRYDAETLDPIRYHFQALVVDQRSGLPATSEIVTLDFRSK